MKTIIKILLVSVIILSGCKNKYLECIEERNSLIDSMTECAKINGHLIQCLTQKDSINAELEIQNYTLLELNENLSSEIAECCNSFEQCQDLNIFLQEKNDLLKLKLDSCENVNQDTVIEEIKAFPEAEGFGKYTRGAYAGSPNPAILIVNTLDGGEYGLYDSFTNKGYGTFRWAVTRTYPRIVLFEVSGTIRLTGRPNINSPYLTIAGESAPSPGITITTQTTVINTSEVIIRNLRFRLGDERIEQTEDALAIYNGTNIYIDHCSVSWACDENFSLSPNDGIKNVSITNCIISEALTPAGTNHRYGLLIRNGTNIFVAYNLFVHLDDRAPFIGQYADSVVIVNNLLYNTGAHGNNIYFQPFNAVKSSVVGNKLIPGNDTRKMQIVTIRHDANLDSRIYLEDNEAPGRTDDPWSVVDNQTGNAIVKANECTVWPKNFKAMLSNEIRDYIFISAGSRPDDRDDVDGRIIVDVWEAMGNIINTQENVGGWPVLEENYRPVESAIGYPASNPHGDNDNDGYSNLEEWLFALK